jgi:hypothetical protein
MKVGIVPRAIRQAALGFGFEIGFAISGVYGAVERLVGFEQNRRHGERIAEIGKQIAGGKDLLDAVGQYFFTRN